MTFCFIDYVNYGEANFEDDDYDDDYYERLETCVSNLTSRFNDVGEAFQYYMNDNSSSGMDSFRSYLIEFFEFKNSKL